MKYEKKYVIVILILMPLLVPGIASAKDYSVTAGDWKVTFNTSTPVSTNVAWTESNGMKGNGFFFIWINTSYQVSSIALLEQPEGVRVPAARKDLEEYLRAETPKELLGSPVNDFKIDGNDGLIAHGWYNELATTAYAACFPADPTPNNTATTIVQYLSFIGEKPSMEIINSLHVEYSRTGATSPPISYNTISTTEPQGNRYSYDFETLGLDFYTPVGKPVVSDDKYTSFIRINLANSASMTGEIDKLYSWEDSSSTAIAAEKLWGGSNYDDHSPLTTSRLDNGDYVVYGRYLSGQYMNTKALRTLDLNNDGQIDYYVVWDGSGKIDQDTITYIAAHTSVRTLKPKWD